MESFTCGLVSNEAKKSFMWARPYIEESRFHKVRKGNRRGWRFCGWESEIVMCRAMGRGAYHGMKKDPHPFDADRKTT